MTKDELARRLLNACAEGKSAEAELTEIDSHFGDADHGLTMRKICTAIESAVQGECGSVKDMLSAAADAVMCLNGGSAVPLWNSWLDGLAEGAPEADALDVPALKAVFAAGLEELDDMSGAKVGDKTMMDALIPAIEAIEASTSDDIKEIMTAGAEAAIRGAEETVNMKANFGRARNYGERSIGYADSGATSWSCMFASFAEAL